MFLPLVLLRILILLQIRTWFDKLCDYHLAKVSNGPTEALNNLVKRIKRIGFGLRNFENYRIRALLYVGSRTGVSSKSPELIMR